MQDASVGGAGRFCGRLPGRRVGHSILPGLFSAAGTWGFPSWGSCAARVLCLLHCGVGRVGLLFFGILFESLGT